jgi:phage shock protein PspC (stress-responsive transcriptional regulator)/predicted membrane protein
MDVPPQAPPRQDQPSSGPRARRLVREPDDRKIAGVCAGLADRLGLDVSLVRVAAVVLAVFTPVGLIAYLVAWAVVPERRPDEPRVVAPPAELPHLGRIPLWLLIVGIVLVVGALRDNSWWSWWPWPNGPVLALALVGLGIWLLVRDDHEGPPAAGGSPGSRAPDEPASSNLGTLGGRDTTMHGGLAEALDANEGAGPPGEFSPPVSPWWSGAETDAATGAARPAGPPAATERPGRSHVALAVVGLLLIATGLAWLLHVLDIATLSLLDGLAAALVIVGLGLVVAAWRGRAWSLVVLGVLIVSTITMAEVIDVPFDAGAGDRRVVVDTRGELADTHELFAGGLTLDLRRAPLTDGTSTMEAAVGLGKLRVIVPRDASVEVDAEVKAGNIDGDLAPSPDEGGVDLHETFDAGPRQRVPDLRLDLRVGVGELEVDRA